MKRKRHTEEQIIAILKEHEAGVKTADLCRKHGISEASFYNWKAKYGGLEVSEAKRLKGLESENVRLKKLLADAMLDNAALKDLLAKKINDDVRCQARGCRSPSFCVRHERAAGVRYRSRRSHDSELKARLRALALERRRFTAAMRRAGKLLGVLAQHLLDGSDPGRQTEALEGAVHILPSRLKARHQRQR
jgi:transposase-like protein